MQILYSQIICELIFNTWYVLVFFFGLLNFIQVFFEGSSGIQ